MIYRRQTDLPYPQPWEYILNMLKHPSNLNFVDVGAYDGITVSNTAYMEMDLNWSGICIEPNPIPFEKLKLNRKSKNYNCCISEIDCELDFISVDGYAEMLSCISTECSAEHMTRIQNEIQKNGGSYKNIKIKSKTLNDIFEENFLEHINYMSIDTEGAELTVLKSLNFKKYKVDVISIECNSNFAASYLMSNGYDYISTVCGDAIFKLK